MSSFAAFWGDLTGRVREEARRRGTSPQAEMHQFVLQRVLARSFVARPDSWIIKGSQGLLARFPDARAALDVDMIGSHADRAGMVADFNDALELDLGDYLTFEPSFDRSIFHGAGAHLGYVVRCGDLDLMEIKADLVPPDSRPNWRPPESLPFPRQIMPTGAPGENPRLRAMSLHDTLARKLIGTYTQRQRYVDTRCESCVPRSQAVWACRSGEMPYRVKDFVDVAFLAANAEWDAADTHALIHEEIRREQSNVRLSVPRRFRVPNPDWAESFAKYAAGTPGLPFKTLDDVVPFAQSFLDPLLSEYPPTGRWDPASGRWLELTRAVPEVERQRILVVADASGRDQGLGGTPVLTGELTTALAGLEHVDVTLLTVGPTDSHGDAKVITIEPVAGQSKKARLDDIAKSGWPDQIDDGLPQQGSDAFDFVIGHGRPSREQAELIRRRWYPYAKYAYVMHVAAERYDEVRDDPEHGASVADERALMERSDLVVGVGPLLTETARRITADSERQPSFHELIPGIDVAGSAVKPEAGPTFNVLFTAHRVNDPIKGYGDLLATVGVLRDTGLPVRLRVRGVPADDVAVEQLRAETVLDAADVVEVRQHTTDQAELDADHHWAHVAVMPSVVEGYGLVGAEAAARGLPLLVGSESGLGQFLGDDSRVPARLGAVCVVPDQGLDGHARVAVWARALGDLATDYPARVAFAAELREVLRAYSWQHAAAAFDHAVRAADRENPGHTVQGPNGEVLSPAVSHQTNGVGRDFVARFTQGVPTGSRSRLTPDTMGTRPTGGTLIRLGDRGTDRIND